MQCTLTVLRAGSSRMRLGGFAHEGADATLSAEDAGTLQFRVDLGHCIGVDAEIDGKLPNGRKLRPAAEPTGDDLSADGALELRINGSRVAGVDGEHGAAYYYTSLLVQHNSTENLYRERKSPAALGAAGLPARVSS